MRFLLLVIFLFVLLPGAAYAQCVNPAGNEGDVVYNETYNVPQYCDNNDTWIAMVGSAPTGPASCPNIGDTCHDGSIYVGLSPDGDLPMYTTPADAPSLITWNDGSYDWSDTAMVNCTDDSPGTAETCRTGEANTAFLVGATGEPDYPFAAAAYCNGLTAHGHSDWYLPALDELNVLYINRNVGDLDGTFDETGSIPESWYWTSSEQDDLYARSQVFSSGFQGAMGKDAITPVRCVRREATDFTQVVPDGLVAHWRLDETSGTVAVDQTGNNDLTYSAGISLPAHSVQGQIGTAIDFGSADVGSSASADNDISPIASTGNFTVTGWIRYEGEPEDSIHGILELPGYFRIRKHHQSLRFHFRADAWDASTLQQGPDIPIGQWMHFAISYSYNEPLGTDAEIYINGEFYPGSLNVWDNTSGGIYSPPTDNRIRLGSRYDSTGSTFQGVIDDVRIYDRILDPEEIREIFEARDGVRYNKTYRVPEFFDGNQWIAMPPPWPDVTDGLVAHWKLDETSGAVAADSVGSGDGSFQGGMDPATSSVRGAIGNAFDFDGAVNEYEIQVTNDSDFADIFAEGGTASLWFYPRTANNGILLYKTTNGNTLPNGYTLQYLWDEDHLLFRQAWDGGRHEWRINTVPTMNQWNHLTVSFDNSSDSNVPTVYLNGDAVSVTLWYDIGSGGSAVSEAGIDLWIGYNIDGYIDDVRLYDRELEPNEIQMLYNMGTPEGSVTALPQGCPEIGDVCDDGTIYAGESPDGNVPMYTMTADAPSLMTWNDGSSNWVDTAMENCTDVSPGTAASCQTGEANTAFLVGLSGSGSPAPYESAEYCNGLSAYGHDDWYLPAQDELNVLYTNKNTGDLDGTFDESGDWPAGWYWSSSEFNNDVARLQRFSDGTQSNDLKNRDYTVRCVRKGPAPRCDDPYGREGDMFYNTTHGVVQYCDGARWVAIGKTAP